MTTIPPYLRPKRIRIMQVKMTTKKPSSSMALRLTTATVASSVRMCVERPIRQRDE
jgi:hypothetical protein